LAAWITLRANPDAHGQVQRILGHKSLGSTMAFYSGMETSAALQHYDDLIALLRAKPPAGRCSSGREVAAMSASLSGARHQALPFAEWPAADRAAWEEAIRRPDFLLDGGRGPHGDRPRSAARGAPMPVGSAGCRRRMQTCVPAARRP
jgi:hypothetical protein